MRACGGYVLLVWHKVKRANPNTMTDPNTNPIPNTTLSLLGWDRYWHWVLGIGRYRRYRFSIGKNASIPAPIPHMHHVCVVCNENNRPVSTAHIKEHSNDKMNPSLFVYKDSMGRDWSNDRLQSSSLCLFACVFIWSVRETTTIAMWWDGEQ